jgi:hypothetical protein
MANEDAGDSKRQINLLAKHTAKNIELHLNNFNVASSDKGPSSAIYSCVGRCKSTNYMVLYSRRQDHSQQPL